jgi:hypothetical protein
MYEYYDSRYYILFSALWQQVGWLLRTNGSDEYYVPDEIVTMKMDAVCFSVTLPAREKIIGLYGEAWIFCIKILNI